MVFEVKLPFPYRKPSVSGNAFFQFIEIRAGKFLSDGRNALNAFFHADGSLQHLSGRAAAAVPVAVRNENVVVDILILIAHPAAHNSIRMKHAVIGRKIIFDGLADAQRRDQMRQHFRTVDAPPHHRIVRYFVKLVPGQFRRHKIIDAALFHDLRERPRISEDIRKPQNPVIHAELFPEESFSV